LHSGKEAHNLSYLPLLLDGDKLGDNPLSFGAHRELAVPNAKIKSEEREEVLHKLWH